MAITFVSFYNLGKELLLHVTLVKNIASHVVSLNPRVFMNSCRTQSTPATLLFLTFFRAEVTSSRVKFAITSDFFSHFISCYLNFSLNSAFLCLFTLIFDVLKIIQYNYNIMECNNDII